MGERYFVYTEEKIISKSIIKESKEQLRMKEKCTTILIEIKIVLEVDEES